MTNDLQTGFDEASYPFINKGLDGVVAFSTTKSSIDGQKGELIYTGYNIDVLAEKSTFEEVCFLLWNDRLPNQSELEDLTQKFQARRDIPKVVTDYLHSVDKESKPMSVLRTATSMLSETDIHLPDDSYYEKAINITAKLPTIIAAFSRLRSGKEIVSPKSIGSTAFNFLYMLNGEEPGKQAEKTLDLCLILHAEHGMNASTFTCRTVGGTLSDLYSAITAGIGTLKGLRWSKYRRDANAHGAKEQGEEADAVAFTKDKLAKKEKSWVLVTVSIRPLTPEPSPSKNGKIIK